MTKWPTLIWTKCVMMNHLWTKTQENPYFVKMSTFIQTNPEWHSVCCFSNKLYMSAATVFMWSSDDSELLGSIVPLRLVLKASQCPEYFGDLWWFPLFKWAATLKENSQMSSTAASVGLDVALAQSYVTATDSSLIGSYLPVITNKT